MYVYKCGTGDSRLIEATEALKRKSFKGLSGSVYGVWKKRQKAVHFPFGAFMV